MIEGHWTNILKAMINGALSSTNDLESSDTVVDG